VTKKPFWVSDSMLVNKVKKYWTQVCAKIKEVKGRK
jgi:hypothetical protein